MPHLVLHPYALWRPSLLATPFFTPCLSFYSTPTPLLRQGPFNSTFIPQSGGLGGRQPKGAISLKADRGNWVILFLSPSPLSSSPMPWRGRLYQGLASALYHHCQGHICGKLSRRHPTTKLSQHQFYSTVDTKNRPFIRLYTCTYTKLKHT